MGARGPARGCLLPGRRSYSVSHPFGGLVVWCPVSVSRLPDGNPGEGAAGPGPVPWGPPRSRAVLGTQRSSLVNSPPASPLPLAPGLSVTPRLPGSHILQHPVFLSESRHASFTQSPHHGPHWPSWGPLHGGLRMGPTARSPRGRSSRQKQPACHFC